MSEEQLRDVLARVVPDPPDSVADPVPVVRAARVRRRAQVVGAVGAMALVAVAGVMGGRGLVDDDTSPQVADEPPAKVTEEPSLSVDPYAATPCPNKMPAVGAFPTDAEVVAVRYCGQPFAGFPSAAGPLDALVDGVGSFVDAVADLPAADPARCAAISMMPGDDRLVLALADGTSVTVPAAMCQDVEAGARMVDGGSVAFEFLNALDAQRDTYSYSERSAEPLTCQTPLSSAPVEHARDEVVEAVFCPATDAEAPGTPITDSSLDELREAWTDAVPLDPLADCASSGQPSSVLARTDRGDVVRLDEGPCGHLEYTSWAKGQQVYWVEVIPADLIAS